MRTLSIAPLGRRHSQEALVNAHGWPEVWDGTVDEGRRRRVALGIVDEWESLKQILFAFDELDRGEFDVSDAILVGLPDALGGDLATKLTAEAGLDGESLPRVFIQDPATGPSDRGQHTVHGGNDGGSEGRLSHFEDWLSPDLAADLRRQLDAGACLLIVPVASEEIERGVCRALLRFAADRVQAHDLHGI